MVATVALYCVMVAAKKRKEIPTMPRRKNTGETTMVQAPEQTEVLDEQLNGHVDDEENVIEFVDFSTISDKLPKGSSSRTSILDFVNQSILIFPPLLDEHKMGRKNKQGEQNVREWVTAECQLFDPETKKTLAKRQRMEIPKRTLSRVRASFNYTGGSKAILVRIIPTTKGATIQ